MDSAFTLQPVTRADVPELLALIRELARFERLEHEVVATEALLAEALFGATRNAEALIGRKGGEAVGFALWFHNFSTFVGRRGLYLEDLYIRPEHRGRGYGRAMLTHLARLALERGCGRMEWAVLDWNVRAEDFYRSLGAEPKSEWRIFRLAGPALAATASSSGAPDANGQQTPEESP
ncbi:MAG: GNAT family N-acetyltransferase [Steroidobacteraceae bacterium]|nr:GNAT family N-acetyltransferase [Steroidobacteraceae bacterium]